MSVKSVFRRSIRAVPVLAAGVLLTVTTANGPARSGDSSQHLATRCWVDGSNGIGWGDGPPCTA